MLPTAFRLSRPQVVTVERTAYALGIVLLALYGALELRSGWGRRDSLARFDTLRASLHSSPAAGVDMTLWSEGRQQAYWAAAAVGTPEPLAVLRIPAIGLVVPVLDGTSDAVLDRAVGRIPGTAWPGEPGNLGVAGHRDGFFRGLKDLGAGDIVELETLTAHERFVVRETKVVDPDAVEVLRPSAGSTLTLVTCYPFYYVGPAPQRYIVVASRQ